MFIDVSGSPYEMGKTHGQAARDWIVENVDIVRRTVTEVKQVDYGFYMKHVLRNMEFVKKDRPDTEEEMQGLAAGAGVPVEDIYLLNVQLFIQAQLLTDDCMMIMARGPATLDGKTYLIKNRDIFRHMHHVAMRRTYPDGTRVCEANPAGGVVWPGNGMNSHGLMVATSGAATANMPEMDLSVAKRAHVTVNPNYVLRACKTVEDVIHYVKELHGPRVFRVNFMAVDHERAVVIEMSDKHLEICEEEDKGLLFRSNYWRSETLARYRPAREDSPNNFNRYDTAERFLKERYGGLRFQDILQLASWHENAEVGSICRHGENGTAMTTYSSMMILEDREMYTSMGNPCEALYLAQL